MDLSFTLISLLLQVRIFPTLAVDDGRRKDAENRGPGVERRRGRGRGERIQSERLKFRIRVSAQHQQQNDGKNKCRGGYNRSNVKLPVPQREKGRNKH